MEKITLNFWALFYIIAFAQGIFVSFLLLKTGKGKRNANLHLSALVFILSVYLFDLFLARSNLLYALPHLVYFAVPLWYLFAPLTYFYIKSVFDEAPKRNWKYLLHFIPFLFVLTRMLPFYLLPPEVKLNIWANQIPPPSGWLFNYLYALIAPVQIFVYALVVLKIVNDRVTSASEEQQFNEAHLSWLQFTFCLLLVYATIRVGFISHYFLTGISLPFVINLQFLVFSIIIYSIAYFAIINPERIFPPRFMRRKLSIHLPTKVHAKRLIELVESQKLYLNSDLKYTDLAQRMNISARYLTEVLNKEIGCSFNDFINTYRVEEVKKRMLTPENANLSLLAIALDSGFSNKSSFNRIFKKHCGVTPSEFLAKNRPQGKVPAAKRA